MGEERVEECEYIICCDNININNLIIIIILAAIHIGSVPRWSIVCLRRLVPCRWKVFGVAATNLVIIQSRVGNCI